MVRQMLGAVNEFVAASARERLAHGRAKALQEVACDPEGARSCQGDPKLGAPVAILEKDPELMKKMKTYAEMPEENRPSYDQIAKELKKQNKQWSVQKKGKTKGKPWAAKQISMFLLRLNATKKVKKMPAPKATSSRTSTTKDQKATTKGQYGRREGSKKAKEIKPPGARAPGLGGTTWSASARASAPKCKKAGVTLPFMGSG